MIFKQSNIRARPRARTRARPPAGIRALTSCLVALVTLIACAADAAAQAFPSKPVTIVAPFPPGGINDILARTLGNRLAEMWKQPVIVVNKPGASGNIGAA